MIYQSIGVPTFNEFPVIPWSRRHIQQSMVHGWQEVLLVLADLLAPSTGSTRPRPEQQMTHQFMQIATFAFDGGLH